MKDSEITPCGACRQFLVEVGFMYIYLHVFNKSNSDYDAQMFIIKTRLVLSLKAHFQFTRILTKTLLCTFSDDNSDVTDRTTVMHHNFSNQ